MPTISVLYPRTEGATFDYDYYEATHLPLVRARWGNAGLTAADALRGISSAEGGAPPFVAMAFLHFTSMEGLQAAMAGAHAAEIMGDVANFTTIQPVQQINEIMR